MPGVEGVTDGGICRYAWTGVLRRREAGRFSAFEAAPDGAKPVELLKYLLANSCPPGGLVLDPCAGTGGTAIAAEASGMRACLAEASPAACDVIRRRWAEFVHGAGCDWRALTPAVSERGAPWAGAGNGAV